MLCFASIHKLCPVSSVHRAEEIRPSQAVWRLGPIDMHSSAPPLASIHMPVRFRLSADREMCYKFGYWDDKEIVSKQTLLSYLKKKLMIKSETASTSFHFSFSIFQVNEKQSLPPEEYVQMWHLNDIHSSFRYF